MQLFTDLKCIDCLHVRSLNMCMCLNKHEHCMSLKFKNIQYVSRIYTEISNTSLYFTSLCCRLQDPWPAFRTNNFVFFPIPLATCFWTRKWDLPSKDNRQTLEEFGKRKWRCGEVFKVTIPTIQSNRKYSSPTNALKILFQLLPDLFCVLPRVLKHLQYQHILPQKITRLIMAH